MDVQLEAPLPRPEAIASDAAAAGARKSPVDPAGGWACFLRGEFASHVLALTDQAVVSGASFLSTVMVGRATHVGELGAYAIGVSVMVSAFAIQESLVTLPYAIQRHRPPGTPAEHAGSSLMHSGLLSLLAAVLLAAAAVCLFARGTGPAVTALTFAMAAVMPFALLREFARRFAFAQLRIEQALALDAAVAAIQLGLLSWLASTGRMSAATAVLALGIACAAGAVAWLILGRANFAIRSHRMRASAEQSWGLGKWLFAGQIVTQVNIYIPYWLAVTLAGAEATGVYAACMSVVAFANPFLRGLGNTLLPRAVVAWRQRGTRGLWRRSVTDALLLGVPMALFCVAVAAVGDDVVRWLYRSQEFAGHGVTMTVLTLAVLAATLGIPATNALASIERPRANVAIGAGAALVTLFAVWSLEVRWGLLGIACGALTGNVVGSIARWAALWHALRVADHDRSARLPSPAQ